MHRVGPASRPQGSSGAGPASLRPARRHKGGGRTGSWGALIVRRSWVARPDLDRAPSVRRHLASPTLPPAEGRPCRVPSGVTAPRRAHSPGPRSTFTGLVATGGGGGGSRRGREYDLLLGRRTRGQGPESLDPRSLPEDTTHPTIPLRSQTPKWARPLPTVRCGRTGPVLTKRSNLGRPPQPDRPSQVSPRPRWKGGLVSDRGKAGRGRDHREPDRTCRPGVGLCPLVPTTHGGRSRGSVEVRGRNPGTER